MLIYISIDLFLVNRSFSDSKGRGFISQRSFLLFPYHGFHLRSLDILVETPFLNSIFVLLWTKIALAAGVVKRQGTLRRM